MKRPFVAVAVACALSGASVPVIAAPSSAAGLPNVGYNAYEYGSYVRLGSVVTSGPTATSGIACTNVAGKTVQGALASATVPGALTVGAVTTTGATTATSTQKRSQSSSKVAGVKLLGGQITADAITTTSSSWVSSTGAYDGSNAMSLVNLKVLGQAINPNVPANTRISLGAPGQTPFGSVVVNARGKSWVGNSFQTVTVGLVVTISGTNPLGLPIGSQINVGYSRAQITRPIVGFVGGWGASTTASLANGMVKSTPTALAYVNCTGGEGTANVAGATVPGLVSTGTLQTDVTSTVTTTSRTAQVRNSTASPNVLAGLVSARAVVAQVRVTRAGTTGPVSIADSSTFLGLRIAGIPALTDAVKPNTVISVPGLGTVTLHKVVRTPTGISVTMVEVVLGQPLAGLPTGSVVRIGMANASVL